MQPTTDTDYKQLFSQLIKKQILVLGPDITLAKVRNVTGLTVDINGDVQKIEGDPQLMLQSLINQFVELSGMIVKKTMESILTSYPGMMGLATGSMTMAAGSIMTPQSAPQVSQPVVLVTAPAPTDAPEPPPITAVTTNEPVAVVSSPALTNSGPAEADVTSQDMAELNKALENLSKAPLSTETQASATMV
jgi:hypothetical protein